MCHLEWAHLWLLHGVGRADDAHMTEAAQKDVKAWRAVAPRQPPDETGHLICKIAAHDLGAFARLYDDVAPLVYGVACRVIRDVTLAEEVTQDVLLTVMQQAPRYDAQRGSGRSWILTIAHRRAVDVVRSEQSLRERNDQYGRDTTGHAFDDVVETVETRLDHAAVAAALGDLSALQRQAVTLAYFGGHTYQEVAQLLDTPLGTVKTRIRDGLIRLRQALDATGAFAT